MDWESPSNATHDYGIGGLIQDPQPWAIGSCHAALFDCMSQWTFGKGTAASNGHQFYLESPPVSPRSGPTHSDAPIPLLTIGEEIDDLTADSGRLDAVDGLEDNGICKSWGSIQPESLLSTPSLGNTGVLEGVQPLVTLWRHQARSSQRKSYDDHTSQANVVQYSKTTSTSEPCRRYRVGKRGRRWSWLSPRATRKITKDAQQEKRLRVAKSRKRITRLYPRLYGSLSSDVVSFPSRSSDDDQPEFALEKWEEQKAASISGPVMGAGTSNPDSPRRPPYMKKDQLPTEGELPSEETAQDQSGIDSSSSYSETEADVSDFEQPHPLESQRDRIVNLLLESYGSYNTTVQQYKSGPNSNETGSGSNESHTEPHSSTSRGRQTTGQKRKGGPQESEDVEDDDDTGPRRHKRPKRAEEESTEHQSFACPFSKKSPARYRRCYRYDLKRVRDVKQHLRRCHRRAIYCPVCSKTFPSEEARDTHVRRRNCLENASMTVDGINDLQAQKLNGKCSSKTSAEQQWFHVFDICFPGHDPPRSPSVDRLLSAELQSFRDYASAEGPSIMMEQLRGVRIWNEQDSAFLRQVLSDGLERIADRWSQSLTPCDDPKSDGTSSNITRASVESDPARPAIPPPVPRLARGFQGEHATTSAPTTTQPQISGFLSDDDKPCEAVPQAGASIFELDVEFFDFSMLPTDAQATTATGEVDFAPDLWSLQYGPNREVAI
ncbi:hypothetical protein N8I77_012155 [Diaporthe amygdali]|uniref:C2H2-type domain-containing protein n=1 Tax=Phomopsis amygdali TaxID=1214568 RepID=A0AAD9VXW1_PHOAM|nr:hypothetical protein N8I77_012155 [Diaporthe amygdali]